MSTKDPKFSERLRQLEAIRTDRLGGEPSNRVLATAAGVSPTTIGTWLRGDKLPKDVEQLVKMVERIRREARLSGVWDDTLAENLDPAAWRAAHQAAAHRIAEQVSAGTSAAIARAALAETRRVLLDSSGAVPRVRAVSLRDLGVHPAAVPRDLDDVADHFPPYVPRDCDQELESAFAKGGLLIVRGRSASGKSRAAAEVMRRVAPDRLLLIPWDRAALVALAEPPGALRDAVIWLDDFERYCGENGLDPHLLNRLVPPGRTDIVILATLRPEELPDPAAARLLSLASIVRPAFTWSPDERGRAERMRDAPLIAEWLDSGSDTGLAEYVAAGPAAVDRWQAGRDGAGLVGAALVAAAVDCRRTGYHLPVPLAVLSELCPLYLDARDAHRFASNIAEGVDWAITPVHGASSCLLPSAGGLYRAFDYLVDYVERDPAADPILEPVWRAMLDLATCADLPALVAAAARDSVRTNRPALTDLAVARQGPCYPFESMAELVLKLFVLNDSDKEGWGYVDRYERWLQPFVEAGELAAMAALGVLLYTAAGRPDEGERWLRQAATAGDDGAAADLAELLHEGNRTTELNAWLDEMVTGGRGRVVTGFATALIRRGEREEAERRLRHAADADCVPAITQLAALAVERNDDSKARGWYERAVELGDPASMVTLGLLCHEHQEWERAERLFREAAEAGNPEGMCYLGRMLRLIIGKGLEAASWFRRAAEEGYWPAAVEDALMMYDNGDSVGLATWWERAKAHDRGGHTVRELAAILARRQDWTGARRWYRRAVELEQPDALTGLGAVLGQLGDSEGEIAQYRRAAELGEIVGIGSLGAKLMRSDQLAEAEKWLERAASANLPADKSDFVEATQVNAMYNLGNLLRRQGRHTEALKWYRRAAERGDVPAAERCLEYATGPRS